MPDETSPWVQSIKARDDALAMVAERFVEPRPKTITEIIEDRNKSRPMRHWRIGGWRTSGYTLLHAWSNVKQHFKGVWPPDDEIVEIVPVKEGGKIAGWEAKDK